MFLIKNVPKKKKKILLWVLVKKIWYLYVYEGTFHILSQQNKTKSPF